MGRAAETAGRAAGAAATKIPFGVGRVATATGGAAARFLDYMRSGAGKAAGAAAGAGKAGGWTGRTISEQRGQPDVVSKNTTLRQQLFETNFLGFRKIIDWKNWFSQDDSYLNRWAFNKLQTQKTEEMERKQTTARILHESDPDTYNPDGSRKVDAEGEDIPTAQQLEAEQLAERTRRNQMRDRMQELMADGMSVEDASQQVTQEFTPQEGTPTQETVTVSTEAPQMAPTEPEAAPEIIDPDVLPDNPIVASNEAKNPDVTKSALGNLVDYVGYNR